MDTKTQVLFPQRRMVAYYRQQSERYLRIAAKTNVDTLRDFALSRAADYEADANTEERAIYQVQS
jgi:hypothetical protein